MAEEKRLAFVSSSVSKQVEFQSLLPGWTIDLMDLPIKEIQSLEPSEVLREKLLEAAKQLPIPFLAEKTCLMLSCLGGNLPGSFTQAFAQALGKNGISEFVLKNGDDRARVVTLVGYFDGSNIQYFQGEVSGKIVPPRGDGGFSWDSIFQPDGFDQTFGEMGTLKKNQMSHRKIACDKLRAFLEKTGK
ncbi:MAG: non-canonical purine NTP pyrophosphatase [archaeon]